MVVAAPSLITVWRSFLCLPHHHCSKTCREMQAAARRHRTGLAAAARRARQAAAEHPPHWRAVLCASLKRPPGLIACRRVLGACGGALFCFLANNPQLGPQPVLAALAAAQRLRIAA